MTKVSKERTHVSFQETVSFIHTFVNSGDFLLTEFLNHTWSPMKVSYFDIRLSSQAVIYLENFPRLQHYNFLDCVEYY